MRSTRIARAADEDEDRRANVFSSTAQPVTITGRDSPGEIIMRAGRNDPLEAFRQRAPAAYEKNAVFILPWQIITAQILGRREAVMELIDRFAVVGGMEPTLFDAVLDRLMYHGWLDAAVTLLRKAWVG